MKIRWIHHCLLFIYPLLIINNSLEVVIHSPTHTVPYRTWTDRLTVIDIVVCLFRVIKSIFEWYSFWSFVFPKIDSLSTITTKQPSCRNGKHQNGWELLFLSYDMSLAVRSFWYSLLNPTRTRLPDKTHFNTAHLASQTTKFDMM